LIDGIQRSDEAENRINEALALCFSGANGEFALKYLRSISIERVMGPNFDPNSLAHIEGQRFLVGIIEQRIKRAKEGNQP
jgi:hypothetical protein